MDPKLIYWTAAFGIMAAAVVAALAAWYFIRRGDVPRHRFLMNTAIVLVGVFLLSYVAKVLVLGKEDLDAWSREAVFTLYVHETIVLVMIVVGAAARLLARKLWPLPSPGGLETATRRRHRLAGRTAVGAAIFGLLTAAMVLAGMYVRAGA